jgi:hypothetical protein
MMMGKSQIYAFFVFSFLIDLCGTSSPTTLYVAMATYATSLAVVIVMAYYIIIYLPHVSEKLPQKKGSLRVANFFSY